MGTSDHDPLSADDQRWLDRISTNSMAVHDAGQFVLRYGPAIRAYCESLLPRPHEVDDVLQDLLVRVVERGFPSVDASKGRFRDYLKATVRNAVMTHLRRPRATRYRGLSGDGIAEEAFVPSADEPAADRAWIDQWRRCLLDRAWTLLDAHQREHPDGWACAVLRAAVEDPEATSDTQAERMRMRYGCSMNGTSFRKQLSRARRLFARLVVQEVAATLEHADADRVQEELIDCRLWESIRELIPPDWQTTLLPGNASH